jgi:hypothetical protein
VIDCDWRFVAGDPLHMLQACGPDIVGTRDDHFVNVGLLFVRSRPWTVNLLARVANRTRVAWDQAVFNDVRVMPKHSKPGTRHLTPDTQRQLRSRPTTTSRVACCAGGDRGSRRRLLRRQRFLPQQLQ